MKSENKVGYEDRDKLLTEWKELFCQEGDFYIYGAAGTAKAIFNLAKATGVSDKIAGFVVTSEVGNEKKVEGRLVTEISRLTDKEAIILVPHAVVFKEEIHAHLKKLEFHRIYFIRRYLLLAGSDPVVINDACMEKARQEIDELEKRKDDRQKCEEELLERELVQLRDEGRPDFGDCQFYQSFERIGIKGKRPTLYRIQKYGIREIVKKEFDILDIGCNSGFLDMEIASSVNSVTGIEMDGTLVTIANRVKDYIKASNCKFINTDFDQWYLNNDKTFDVVFSFAIHHWLNLSPLKYVERLGNLIRPGGYLFLESHDYATSEKEYEDICSILLGKEYAMKNQGDIIDDGFTKRKWAIFQKGTVA